MTRFAWCVLIGACATAVAAQGPPPAKPPAQSAPAPSREIEKLLREWDARSAKLHDLQVPFEQQRKLAIRKRVTRASGVLSMRRDPKTGKRAIRWQFEKPRKRVEVLRASEVRTWEAWLPKEKQVVEVRDLRAFGLDPEKLHVLGRSSVQLRKHYAIRRLPQPKEQPAPAVAFRIALVPKDPMIAKRVVRIELTIDRLLALPSLVAIYGPARKSKSGKVRQSVTTYRFALTRSRRNTGLKPELFVLAPAGIPIKRR